MDLDQGGASVFALIRSVGRVMRWTVQFDQVSRQRGYDLVRFVDIYFNVGTCTFPIDLMKVGET
jgi:hypothetical protein